MWKNYLKVALRNLGKYKVFSFINISGLAIGLAACLLILQYVSFELSYDQFNPHAKDLYRVVNDRYQNGKLVQHGTITYSGISKAMKTDFPDEIAEYTRVEPYTGIILTYNNKKLQEDILAADESFLRMFSYPLLAGDRATALKEPNSLILTETLARALFDFKGNDFQPLVGKSIKLQKDSFPYKVTGICKDLPGNSHLQFNLLLSYVSLYQGGNNNWAQADYDFTDSDFWHYIQLKPGVDYKKLQAKFKAFSQRHFQGNKVSGSDEVFYLQPLFNAHLYSDFEYEIGKTGSSTAVWGLLILAVIIIVIAWVNFINLSTAKSVERAKEVGVRKVIGALRSQLIKQFMAESVLVNIISILLALVLVLLVQPVFNTLLGFNFSLSFLFTKGLNGYSIISGLILLVLAGILISGLYPAFVLSSFKPIAVLKGKLSTSGKGIVLRKALVVGQFTITIALIIGAAVVYRQVRFMNTQELGLNMDQMLVINSPSLTQFDSTFITTVESFKEELKQLPNVKAATAGRLPGGESGRTFNVHRADDSTNNRYTLRNWGINHDFLTTYQIKLLVGRDFSMADYNADFGKLHNVLLNETAVKLLGFSSKESAIGRQIVLFGKTWDVAGVTADFHQKSLHYVIEPMVMLPTYTPNADISVKLNPANLPVTLAAIRKKYETFFPGNLFDYSFLNDRFNRQYAGDQLFGKIFGLFAGLAIFIASLGLFGLSLYATTQRTKEIGVRKVLGASVSNLVLLLSKDFIRLVFVAGIIAFPLAWWMMHAWLNKFAYRTDIAWWVFAAAGLLSLLIALATISFQAIKAAMDNPVKSLRSE
jgi:putative ABC transport system permease protein